MTTELAVKQFNFEITSLKEAMDYAKLIADSDLAPKDYKGKPGNVLIAIQYGMEIGLKPMQAIQNIAVINGRHSIWGDAMIALVQSNPLCEYINERFENETAYCTVKRRGEEEYTYEFSKADAKTAGLLGKAGPWGQYPDRMCQMRARGFALRDKFSDVLKGISIREEARDYQIIEHNSEDSKAAAANKIVNLIANKSKDEPSAILGDFRILCQGCVTLDQLDDIAEEARSYDDSIKDEARKIYKQRRAELLNADETTGEINKEAVPNESKKQG